MVILYFRTHDECNGSDVFGSDICTCRPYLTHGIEECIKTAQEGGVGVIVYFRKEGTLFYFIFIGFNNWNLFL